MDHYNFYALFGLADCYRGMNQQFRSLEYWNMILDQDPRNKVILTRSGDAYRNLNDYDKAKEYYQRALNIEFDTYAVLGLAIVAKAQGKYDEASESLARLIPQDPKNFRLYMELADCYLKMGDKTRAKDVLADFQKLGIRNTAVSEMMDKLNS
jgi:tetratricopeptide (TPR) repeat protein